MGKVLEKRVDSLKVLLGEFIVHTETSLNRLSAEMSAFLYLARNIISYATRRGIIVCGIGDIELLEVKNPEGFKVRMF